MFVLEPQGDSGGVAVHIAIIPEDGVGAEPSVCFGFGGDPEVHGVAHCRVGSVDMEGETVSFPSDEGEVVDEGHSGHGPVVVVHEVGPDADDTAVETVQIPVQDVPCIHAVPACPGVVGAVHEDGQILGLDIALFIGRTGESPDRRVGAASHGPRGGARRAEARLGGHEGPVRAVDRASVWHHEVEGEHVARVGRPFWRGVGGPDDSWNRHGDGCPGVRQKHRAGPEGVQVRFEVGEPGYSSISSSCLPGQGQSRGDVVVAGDGAQAGLRVANDAVLEDHLKGLRGIAGVADQEIGDLEVGGVLDSQAVLGRCRRAGAEGVGHGRAGDGEQERGDDCERALGHFCLSLFNVFSIPCYLARTGNIPFLVLFVKYLAKMA